MLIQTNLPKGTSFFKKITYPVLRRFFFFFFSYLPYYPIRRVNKPDLSGTYIWACSHSNFLCDVIPAGYEGERPTKFLAKSTLFRFPIKGFIEYCGALPVARPHDSGATTKENRLIQNKNTFKAAIAAMKQGWPIAIFPEGASLVLPGLFLPLKPGVARLAFFAEEENQFALGVRIIPVGLEYGSRNKVASGLTIRYGKPLTLRDYKELFEKDEPAATKKLMDDLTNEMIACFPHFKSDQMQFLGRKIVAMGLARSKHSIAQLFLKKENDPDFWDGLNKKLLAFEEANKGSGIPLPAWGLRRKWKELGPKRRRKRLFFIFSGLPIGAIDVVNNSIPELILSSAVDYFATDETEKMSMRFIFSPFILSAAFGLQFFFLKKIVFTQILADAGFFSYISYLFGSFAIWYFSVHWRRQLKRFASLLFFKRAGVDGRSEAVAHYRSLRQHLGEL